MTTTERTIATLGADTSGPVYDLVPSPIGTLLLVADRGALVRIGIDEATWPRTVTATATLDPPAFTQVRQELQEYFVGERTTFGFPLRPAGTSFQLAVWEALRAIPYGTTTTYRAIATAVGRPEAARAVGGANHLNPLPIVVPCHRVIGADGSLTGFSGGIERKSYLLDLERAASISPAW